MRIIAGTLGGRRLDTPRGTATRPTSDRVREALFSILGPAPNDARVLDLFAGSGALGLEALSRGATHAVFVDNARAALQVLRKNIDALDVADRCTIISARDALRTLDQLAQPGDLRFHWIFLDPPYASDLAARSLARLGSSQLLAAGAKVIVEHDRRQQLLPRYGSLVRTDLRQYGDTEVSIFEPREPQPEKRDEPEAPAGWRGKRKRRQPGKGS